MSPLPQPPLRVVLVDFDWQDAEAMLRLARRPEVSIRLVIGSGEDNPGVRIADLGGLPYSSDLGDLTREVFDLAVISERSPRRNQVTALLNVLGTPIRSPESLAREAGDLAGIGAEGSRGLEVQALALESELSGTDALTLLATHARLSPDPREESRPASREAAGVASVAEPGPAPREEPSAASRTEPSPAPPEEPRAASRTGPGPASRAEPSHTPPSAEAVPALANRTEIEGAIHDLVALTGALHAELRLEGTDALEVAIRIGSPDSLADMLSGLALGEESEQVVRVIRGSAEGRCSGAWPIRTPRGLALLCASGMDPNGPWEAWRELSERLRDHWTRPDPGPVESHRPIPAPPGSWQSPDRFRQDLERALEQTREEGARYSLHRFRFVARGPELEELFELLPRHLRSNDLLCRPDPQTLLLLTTAAPDTFFRLNQRILELWEGCWRMSGETAPDPRVDIESVELVSADGGLEFLDRAARWLQAA